MPFKIGVGGFLRSYCVLPKLTNLLASDYYEIEVYIPANAIRTFIVFHLKERRGKQKIDFRSLLDESFDVVLHEVKILEKQSKYSFVIDEKVLKKNIEYNREFLSKELKWRSLYNLLPSENFRPLLIHFYEKKFVDSIRYYFSKPTYAYSMHETPDAITALGALSSSDTRVAVLLQLDLGRRFLEKMFNLKLFENISEKTKLIGFLSVSPAPIIETPELLHLSKNIRILVPGVAFGDDIPRGVIPKEPNTVVYYGRISREKGIFDLLKAWSIVEKHEDATLYIAGKFEDYRTEVEFEKLIRKYGLKRVVYLGYLNREKLLNTVSCFSMLAYPSYRDSFPVTVRDSLAIGLRVVAYDIPALRFIYRGSRNVELMPVGDFKQLSLSIVKNLKKPFERNDIATRRILNLYSSWEKVALEEYNHLIELLMLHQSLCEDRGGKKNSPYF
jgi:glycosyltransferase involved in cell wall biosynthesis